MCTYGLNSNFGYAVSLTQAGIEQPEVLQFLVDVGQPQRGSGSLQRLVHTVSSRGGEMMLGSERNIFLRS